ncbi:MAG: hypothetical protein JSR46_11640, partial [Verrucomicrobia bacterium]|nr:hypothetical protein [Verrucomicrobiota bacterium]
MTVSFKENPSSRDLTLFNSPQPPKELADKMFPWRGDNSADLKRFASFEPADVQSALISKSILSSYVMKLVSDKQLKALQISKLSRDIIDRLFPLTSDNTIDRKRFANIQAAEVGAAVAAGLIRDIYSLKLLSDEHLKQLPLSKMSKVAINNLFPWASDNTSDRKRFANIQAAEVGA